MSEQSAYVPPRPEIEVAADTVARLIKAGLIAPGMHGRALSAEVGRACTAAGISLDDLRLASIRLDRGYVEPPRSATLPPRPQPAPAPEPTPTQRVEQRTRATRDDLAHRRSVSEQHRRANEAKAAWQRANPAPGMRRCARCRETFHVEHFPIKDQASGRRRSYCGPEANDCWRTMQRDRYLSVARLGAMQAAGVTFVVQEGDGCIGLACARCAVPLDVDDEVSAQLAGLAHNLCPTSQGDQP